MHKSFYIACLLLLTFSYRAPAQFLDSLRSALNGRSKVIFNFGSRNSFVSNARASIYDVNVGVSFAQRLIIGGGLHFLNNGSAFDQWLVLYNRDKRVNEQVNKRLNLYYWGYYMEFVYYKNKRWECTIPLQVGIGESSYTYFFSNHQETHQNRMIILYEPAVSVEFMILRWLSANGNIGYRFMLKNNRTIPQNFNSLMYSFGISIWWSSLYKMVFPHTKLAEKL